MTAKEANRISKENINEYTRNELKKINNRIKETAEKGYFQIVIYYKIDGHIKEHYEDLGYNVTFKPQQNQPTELTTFIDWQNDRNNI